MAYKHIRKSPPLEPQTMAIPGGRTWTKKTSGVPGWSAQDNSFDILQSDEYVVLVSFIHEPNDRHFEFWRKRCKNVREAMELAERI